MPVNSRYTCNTCDFELPTGWGGYTYAVDEHGQRKCCPHPGEVYAIHRITGMNYTEARAARRAGFAQHCLCTECLTQFDLDLERDALVCPACSAPQVRSLRSLIGQECPRCKVGIIEEGSLVRWALDSGWEKLPVPEIVKDLVVFSETRQVPPSLERAAAIADGFGKHNFFVLTLRLLNWWEGEYFSEDQEQQESAEMWPQWTWCKALPLVLGATPALAELVVIGKKCCRFADSVTPDMRRGIKNYLRKHRKHVVMS